MADIFGSSNQVPAWLREVARPVDATRLGETIGTGLAEISVALSRDPNAAEDSDWLHSRKGLTEAISEVRANQTDQFWKLKTAQMQNNIAAGQARTAAEVALANDRFRETSAWMEDIASTAPAWLSDTPDGRSGKPAPQAKSKTMLGLIQKTKSADDQYLVRKQSADNQSAAAKQKVQDNADLIKRFNALDDPVTREQIRQIKDPSQRLQALVLAEAAQKTRKANEANQARADAEARGEKPTTTITAKGGVTETYKPVTAPADVTPKETSLSDGTRLVFNPKSGHFVLERAAESKKMTPAQLRQVAESMDKKDPNRALILRSLASNAVAQVTAPKTSSTTATNPPPSSAAPSKAASPSTPKVTIQSQADVDEVIRQANEAIGSGKDPAIIRKRLQDMGIKLKD